MSNPSELLKGKVAAVTGALTGLGRAIAVGFLQQGCKVAVGHLGGPKEEQAFNILRTETMSYALGLISVGGDISYPQSSKDLVDAAVSEWGRLDMSADFEAQSTKCHITNSKIH